VGRHGGPGRQRVLRNEQDPPAGASTVPPPRQLLIPRHGSAIDADRGTREQYDTQRHRLPASTRMPIGVVFGGATGIEHIAGGGTSPRQVGMRTLDSETSPTGWERRLGQTEAGPFFRQPGGAPK